MDRDDVLRLSREEGRGRPDEREALALGLASRAGLRVGVLACVALAFVGGWLLDDLRIALAGWVVCFAMQGSGSIALFKELNSRSYLWWGILEVFIAVAFTVMLVFAMPGA